MTELVKTLENLSDRERQLVETCFHEAGHCVAGVVAGGILRLATVVGGLAPGAAQITGNTKFDHLPPGQDAAVAYAGPWCVARWRRGGRPSQRDVFEVLRAGGCEDDKVLLRALPARWRPRGLCRYMRRAGLRSTSSPRSWPPMLWPGTPT